MAAEYYSFSTEVCSIDEETSHLLSKNYMVPLMKYDINSPVSVASFPEQYMGTGFSDMNAVCDYQHPPGEDYCSGLLPNLHAQNWGIHGKPATKVEEKEVKVGRYSVEERKDRILRYLKKRNHRNFNKTIKYACRKTLADKRVRIRGRFAKNNEPSEQETFIINTRFYEQNNSLYEDSFQVKYEEDYWFEAAMANLGRLPYLAS